jgi:hypothetical protein
MVADLMASIVGWLLSVEHGDASPPRFTIEHIDGGTTRFSIEHNNGGTYRFIVGVSLFPNLGVA